MTESFNLLRRVQSLDISPELSGYSRVTIYAGQNEKGEDKIYTAGDDTGTTLEITNEWGTPEMAEAILKKIQGWRYQPYKAGGSSIDPSSEIGDAVTISDIYGGIFAKKTTYGKYIRTDLEAPSKEEVEHEFQVQSPTDRQYARFTSDVRSKLTIQAEAIEARVEKVHGKTTESFWWSLQSDGWSVGNQSGAIFKVNSSGAEVEGEIRATSGSIGGFTIKDKYLCTNGQDWGGSNSNGIYIGPEGIQCGSKFSVTMGGELTAEKGTFGSLSINEKNQKVSGTYYGGLSGCGGSVSKLGGSLSGGISVYDDEDKNSKTISTYVDDIVANKITASYINAKLSSIEEMNCKALTNGGQTFSPQTIWYLASDGTTKSFRAFVHI